MICVNELSAAKCRSRDVLEALAVILCPFAPHLSEELWARFGHESSAVEAPWPIADQRYLIEDTKLYPIAINGKTRTELSFPLIAEQGEIEKGVLADETVQKWLEGKSPKKVVYVKGRMINVVV
jgi:leucyl-tRNA synthetase